MSTVQRLLVGPVSLRLEQTKVVVPFIGNYSNATENTSPDLIIEVELSETFANGRSRRADYPAFASKRTGEHQLSLCRLDAEGTLDFPPNQPVVARFKGAARPHTLEAAIRVAASIALPRKEALIMHSSAIADAKGAHMFSGISGAGKSTIAAMLCEHYSVQKMSDELLLLVRKEGSWRLEVAPFSGKETLARGQSRPLRSINFLLQASSNRRSPLPPGIAMRELPRHVVSYAQDPLTLAQVLDLLADLVETIPCYRLEFEKSPSVGEALDLTCP